MSDDLNQSDIDKLLSGMQDEEESGDDSSLQGVTSEDKDTLAELCNISMSPAASTLAEILSTKVEIVSPNPIEFNSIEEVFSTQEDSSLVIFKLLADINSSYLLVMKNTDLAIIADIMMGGTGKIESFELGDLQLSAVGEALNQMMSSSAVSLGSIFNQNIDITQPEIKPITPGVPIAVPADIQDVAVVGVVFKFTVGNVINSEILQLLSVDTSKKLVKLFMGSVDSLLQGSDNQQQSANTGGPRMFGSTSDNQENQDFSSMNLGQQPVTVQPARFSSFDSASSMFGAENQNLDLVLDVGLRLTVELGRAELPIKKVLELTRGSVIELDKIAGEPVDLLANGKLIAKGEVVVIEDNFGLRITSIVSPADRIKNL